MQRDRTYTGLPAPVTGITHGTPEQHHKTAEQREGPISEYPPTVTVGILF